MKKLTNQIRQGDVLVQRVEKLSNTAKVSKEPPILAHGEVTGHCHEIDNAKATTVFRESDSAAETEMFIELSKDATLRHQEHNPIRMRKGVHRVVRQAEYSPAAIRNVAD